MSNRPNFSPSQPTISMNNLPALEELSESEASESEARVIAGGGDLRPGGGGTDPHVLNHPANQVPSISLLGLHFNHNATIVNGEDFHLSAN